MSGAELESNLDRVREGIANACHRSKRDASSVTLVAVTKTVPVGLVARARDLGISDFGENYVQELAAKKEAVPDARWHYVGTLQSHSAHRVADHADVVHSLEPGRAVHRLAARAIGRGEELPAFVQVDLTGRRAGTAPEDTEAFVAESSGLEGLRIAGLMTLPPEPATPEDSRPYFRRLRELLEGLHEDFPGMTELSMGMSLDYEVAVEEGATIVRVGTALFGMRG
jgi:pyridoxal phosphate enzyme (YggS family)